MRSSFCLIAAVIAAVLVFASAAAHAQCAFNAPAKASGFKADLVRAYSSCPGVTFAAPNTVTMAGVPGCGAPVARSKYRFGLKGRCSLRLKQFINTHCPCGQPPCGDVSVRLKCRDVRDGADMPINGPGWSMAMVLRATLDDPVTGDMTVVDSPTRFNATPSSAGSLKLKIRVSELLAGAGCFFVNSLPTCMQSEIVSVGVVDPDGDLFAVLGSSTR